MPDLYIIAGCNGAGKTTAAYRLAAKTDDWYIYDNSGSEYELVAKSVDDTREIINFELFKIITGEE